jgi:hypothetical protein
MRGHRVGVGDVGEVLRGDRGERHTSRGCDCRGARWQHDGSVVGGPRWGQHVASIKRGRDWIIERDSTGIRVWNQSE